MSRPEFETQITSRRGLLAGVCAALAAFIDVPAWTLRAVAVLVLLWHPIFAILGYLGFAAFIRHGRGSVSRRLSALRDHVAPPRMPDVPPAPLPLIDGLAARFATLDLRLARLEARASDPDRLLRRRFDRL
ncbi:PspC domain-containing protein [Acidiphilium sp.]|uniref:PspC domain-containing protein n=1 Tax=Acidiphilium sp. TaxID=527 RepID=UPI003CFC7EC0